MSDADAGMAAVKLVVWAFFGFLTYQLAKGKNRSPLGWVLGAVLLSPILTLLILAFMRKLPAKEAK